MDKERFEKQLSFIREADMKKIQTHKRDALLKNCTERRLSSNTIAAIATIIGQVRRKQGHEGAELKAEELNTIVGSAQSEEEILTAIATMKKELILG